MYSKTKMADIAQAINEKISQANELTTTLQQYKIDGVKKLENKIQQELRFLKRLLQTQVYSFKTRLFRTLEIHLMINLSLPNLT